ncbi:MAG: M1 family metallopeptidase [Cytophagales bacterium]|nr:M1 family metallopeptidase [Cytophagales bacterium]
MRNFHLFFLILINSASFAQSVYTGKYRSAGNIYYWKNNKLLPTSYWQQDVEYDIKATINDSADAIQCQYYKLKYYNNSPHTLHELYFHLYENAFQPGSYYHALWKGNHQKPIFGTKEKQGLGTQVYDMKVNGEAVRTTLDNTILQVHLLKPLPPGDSAEVTCTFTTWWDTGSMRRRNKMYNTGKHKHYDGVHWYPIVCVYDAKMGWHTDQHLDKEFYANFGSFDVQLTFPAKYVVEATGILQNKEEVMPDTLREKLDLKNYINPANKPKPIFYDNNSYKTWKYYATNVHNFAFTADPLYRIDEQDWKGVKVIALVQEPHAAGWKQSAQFTQNVMEIYSHDFGNYIWPKIIVADAQDGMEYPMLTLDGGTYPQHQGLLAHEVGHMWFYGMVANNETYRASLDEGFTQFLTVWSMDKILGKIRARPVQVGKYVKKRTDSIITRYESLYNPYLTDVWSGYDMPLNTHSSDFNGAIRQDGGYRAVYYKTGTMLYNLKYVLGDSLFMNAMRYYVKKYTGAHPYPEDFRQTIIEYAHADLNWFFDQWLETTKHINYTVRGIKYVKENDDGTLCYRIDFKRKGSMQMPIDFRVFTKDFYYDYYIPNTWFVKNTDAKILPKWYGWDRINKIYKAEIDVNKPIKDVVIDPNHIMADIDLRDNSLRSIDNFSIDHRVPSPPKWYQSQNYWRPDLWYNGYDGLQMGLTGYGDYFGQQSFYEYYGYFNSRLGQQDYIPASLEKDNRRFAFGFVEKNNLGKHWRQLYYYDEVHYHTGLMKGILGFEKIFKTQSLRNTKGVKIFANMQLMYRELQSDAQYLLYPEHWSVAKLNSSINTGVHFTGMGHLLVEMRTPGPGASFNYYYLQAAYKVNIAFHKIDLLNRFFVRWGGGDTPQESALYLAGMAPEQLFGNRLTRATGFVPDSWVGYGSGTNHFHMGGGLNIRGYAGYLAPEIADGATYNTYLGKSGLSWTVEIDFDRYIPIRPYRFFKNFHLDTYLFNDIGSISYSTADSHQQRLAKIRTSSGVGTVLTIKFGQLNIKPIVLRFDMPLLLNFAPATEQNAAVRYVVGVGRCF